MLCNLPRVCISFQGMRRSATFIANPDICTWTAEVAAIFHLHLGCQSHLGAALCAHPLTTCRMVLHFVDDMFFCWPFSSPHLGEVNNAVLFAECLSMRLFILQCRWMGWWWVSAYICLHLPQCRTAVIANSIGMLLAPSYPDWCQCLSQQANFYALYLH